MKAAAATSAFSPTPRAPSSQAWDKLQDHSAGAGHPLHLCKILALFI